MESAYLLSGFLTLGMAVPALADQVINDDLIVRDDACFGVSCVDGESFPNYWQLKLDSVTPTLVFEDSTTSPTSLHDWQLQANSGDINGFYLHNLDTGSDPFTILGNAPSDSLFIAADGDIGLGTALPEADLHLSASVPSIIFEATNSSAKWNLNIGSFGVSFLDAANSSNEPLLIENGAPTETIVARATGDVGFGVFSPETGLHVQRNDGKGAILIEETSAGTLGQMSLRNNGITFFTLEDTSIADVDNSGRKWNFQNQAGTFRVTTAPGGPGEIEMILTPAGDMTIEGALTQNSDKNKKMAIEPVDPAAILQKVAELPVSSWMYKDNADLGIRHIGPMAQDFHAAFGVGASETGISSLDTSGVALAAIQALEAQNAALTSRVEQLTDRLVELERQLHD
ncbi:tail fiber domain-containing protein [Roseovarius faecimaris]|uniref:Tail fiber domain-containing protein n=2 Tax=Roseovarius faecimaris TaxID=2494550 RepID=A0A6I6IMI6_9RHOB|nr:tail fiber domain-containing protein [Roseovarius faecimaris]